MSEFESISVSLGPLQCTDLLIAHSIKYCKNLELLWQIRSVTAFHKWKDEIGMGWNRASLISASGAVSATPRIKHLLLVCGLWTDRPTATTIAKMKWFKGRSSRFVLRKPSQNPPDFPPCGLPSIRLPDEPAGLGQGWVKFDFRYSTVHSILLGLIRLYSLAERAGVAGAWWVEHTNHNQLNLGLRRAGSPCIHWVSIAGPDCLLFSVSLALRMSSFPPWPCPSMWLIKYLNSRLCLCFVGVSSSPSMNKHMWSDTWTDSDSCLQLGVVSLFILVWTDQ